MTKIIEKNKADINEIIAALKNGAVLVLPTDTVYGLVCDASDKIAVEKIFKIKKRDESKPLPVFVKDIEAAESLAFIDEEQGKILDKKWPGKYTFILNIKKDVGLYGINKDTIALRIPKYKFLNDLLDKFDKPLVQTSVNISGQPALNKISEITEFFKTSEDQPDLIIGAGDLPKSKSSTIIDLTRGTINILRK